MATQRVNPTGVAATDTAALQAALDTGQPVVMGPGSFLVNAQLLKSANAAPFVGAGIDGTRIVVADTVGASTDILKIAPAVAFVKGGEIGGFTIEPQTLSERRGRHGIHVDLSAIPGGDGGIAMAIFEDIRIEHVNGRSFYLTNPSAANGFYCTTIRDLYCVDGMYFQNLGDSVRIENCTLSRDWAYSETETVPKIGLEVASMVLGANVLSVLGCNVTSCGGGIKFNGLRCYIERLNCELAVNLSNNAAAAVEFTGNSSAFGKDQGSTVMNSQIYAMAGTNADALKLSGTIERFTVGKGTHLQAVSPKKDLVIGASCSYTTIERGVSLEQGVVSGLTDSGSNTQNNI